MRRALAVAALALLAAAARAADGWPDTTFGFLGQVVIYAGPGLSSARDVALSGPGLFLAGETESSPGNQDFWVARLRATDGLQEDASAPIFFDQVAGGDDIAHAIAPAPGGRVVVAGQVEIPGSTYLGVVRLTASDLELDSTFGNGGKALLGFGGLEFTAPDVAVLGDGSVLVGATFGNPSGSDRDFGVFKLLSDGSPDPNFGLGGFASVAFDLGGGWTDRLGAIAVQWDGKIVLAGAAQWGPTDYDFGVARLLGNGDPDTGFGLGNGRTYVFFDLDGAATDLGNAVALGSGGRIAVVGSASWGIPIGAVAMLTPAGELDLSFSGDGRAPVQWYGGGSSGNELTGAAFESDGALFVTGNAYTQWNVSGDLGIARLLAGGSFDPSFIGGGYYAMSFSNGWETVEGVLLDGGRPVLSGTADGSAWSVVRLTNALVFRDGFESADARAWPAP